MRSPKGRKGAKKLQQQRQSGSSPPLGSTKASPRGKRVKAPASRKQKAQQQQKAKPLQKQVEPEVFPEPRNLEDLWKAAFPVGTEWDHMDAVYNNFNWDFSNLEKAFEEAGELHGKQVYLFGCTEPQLVSYNGQSKVMYIPVVVAVTSPFPPSEKIGIKSVQMEGEMIVPMKDMKMGWVPYIPLENRHTSVERMKTQIFTLQCTQRKSALKCLSQERIKKYDYCLPYFYQPLKEEEMEENTTVQIMYPLEPPVVCEFDWELDELEEFTDGLIKEEALSEDQRDEFMKFVKEKVNESKREQRQEREARKKAIEDMSPEQKAAFENMRFYKFYPVQTSNGPDISHVKVPFINRYYGKAHIVL